MSEGELKKEIGLEASSKSGGKKTITEILETEVTNSDDEPTPMAKVLENLSHLNLNSSDLSSKSFVVLVLDGSMNPIHKEHVNIFEIAKKEIEIRENIKVVAGYISPSTDIYVKRKLGDEFISADHRIEMIRIATEDSSWVEVDKQGANFPTGDPLDKVHYLSNYLNSNQEVLKYCNHVEIVYLCGSDLVERDWKNGWRTFDELIKNGYKTVIIGRENSEDWKSKCETYLNLTCEDKKWNEFILLLDGSVDNEVSSTKIRNVIAGREEGDLSKFLSPKVLEYIQKHDLLKKEFQKELNHQVQNAKVEVTKQIK